MNHATPCFHCPLMELLENQIIMTRSQRLINKYMPAVGFKHLCAMRKKASRWAGGITAAF